MNSINLVIFAIASIMFLGHLPYDTLAIAFALGWGFGTAIVNVIIDLVNK